MLISRYSYRLPRQFFQTRILSRPALQPCPAICRPCELSTACTVRCYTQTARIQYIKPGLDFVSKTTAVDTVLADNYPAKAHARRVVEYIKKSKSSVQGVLYLEAQKSQLLEDCDEPVLFR